MPKKRIKKTPAKRQRFDIVFSRIKIFALVVVFLVTGLIAKSLMATERYKVLGATTFLARGGDDSGAENNSGSGSSGSSGSESSGGGSASSNSGGSGSSGSGGSESGSGGSGSSDGSNGGSSSGGGLSVSDDKRVICTGPDGKQFEAELKDCAELNKAWHKPVSFRELPSQSRSASEKKDDMGSSAVPLASQAPEVENENGTSTKTETKPSEEITETRFSEKEKISTRTKDGKTRVDITTGGVKTRLEIQDDRVVIKAEQEDGTETELEDNTLVQVEDRLAEDNIKIATAGASQFLIQKGNTGAVTSFPISVDLANNTLVVNTPSGKKNIVVLPAQAVQNLITASIVSRLGDKSVVDETTKNNLASVNQLIALKETNGIPIYEINGVSDQKLFGFIPVKIEKEITVSAETGNALSINESLGAKILDAISF